MTLVLRFPSKKDKLRTATSVDSNHPPQAQPIYRFTTFKQNQAERGGFEPPVPCETQHFQCCTIGRSATSPERHITTRCQ